MDARQIFLDNLDRIDRIVAVLARRHGLSPDETEDFRSRVHEKLIRDDYAVIRKFRGDSSLLTFLQTVIAHEYLDYRVARWGKWRPTVRAKRLGHIAVQLERLLYRDGHSVSEAIQVLRGRRPDLPSDTQLARLAAQLPARANPRKTVEVPLDYADETVGVAVPVELDGVRSEAERSLHEAVATLAAEDQLILRLRYWEQMSIADIARTLGLEQKPLYRRIEACRARLKLELENRGIDRSIVLEYLGEEAS